MYDRRTSSRAPKVQGDSYIFMPTQALLLPFILMEVWMFARKKLGEKISCPLSIQFVAFYAFSLGPEEVVQRQPKCL